MGDSSWVDDRCRFPRCTARRQTRARGRRRWPEPRAAPDTAPATATGAATSTRRATPPDRTGAPTTGRCPATTSTTRAPPPTPRSAPRTSSQLQVAWKAPVGGSLSTVPIVVGDTVYLQDSSGRGVRARPRHRCAALARRRHRVQHRSVRRRGRRRPRVRGEGSTGAVALDAQTGAVLWTKQLTTTPTEGIDIQPQVVDGTVFFATVPVSIKGIYKGGDRGMLYALDAKTGATKWSFDTVKSPDLWGNAAVNSGGGAWYTPAIDPHEAPRVLGRRQPRAVPRHRGVPERFEPARREPLHRLDRRPRHPQREVEVVPPGATARPLRPRPGARADRHHCRRHARRRVRGQGRRDRRSRPGHREEALAHVGRHPPERRAARRSAAPRRCCPARTAASRRHPPPPTAWCTPRR